MMIPLSTSSPTEFEDAYFKMEIVDAYCRIVLVARQVSSQPNVIPAPRLRELLTTKQTLGCPTREDAWGAGRLCRPRTIAGGFGNSSQGSHQNESAFAHPTHP
jgi:L-fuculose-phosphate aldolase